MIVHPMIRKETILIIDDKPANIYALESLLEKEDRTFLHATNGKDGLKIALNHDIELIILDVQMPDMDGFEVAQILKSNKRTKDIPIIFATAEMGDRQFMMKGFEEGAVDYLAKPLDPEVTKAKVSVLLKIQLQKRELLEKNASLEKAALLINNSPDIIGIIDPNTLFFEEVNQAFTKTLGYSLEEAKRTPFTTFLDPTAKPLIHELSRNQQQNLLFETRAYTKDNTEKWLQWNGIIKDGKWFINARDITQHKTVAGQIKQLNDELQRNLIQLEVTNKELESFSYSVSHDLRAPVRSLNGYSKILQEDYNDKLDDEGRRLLQIIQNNADKMGQLIDDLLSFSKLGKKEILKSEINSERMVDNILTDIATNTPHKANVVRTQLATTFADHALLTQVWINLLSNAIKYSSKKPNPKVEVGSYQTDDETIFYVRDNGAGFSMDYAHKLFGVFQRLHKASDFEGTGVGLAIVQRIIVKHGGRVWAEGKENEGATFYFALPNR